MDRSELLQKLANIGRVVVLALCRADQASALYDKLPLPSMLATFDGGVATVEGSGAAVVQLALREFVLRKLDQLTEEGALWWKRWASAFTLKVCCAKARSGGDEEGGDVVDEGSKDDCEAKWRLPMGECREDLKAWPSTLGYPDGLDGSAQSKIPELMASEASRVWLERLLDTLGGQLQGSVQWVKAINPVLVGAGWSEDEKAPWKLQVEHWLEKIESDEVRRRRLLARARVVDRYRTMMKQLRENERFVSEERTKLYRLGLLPPVADVQPKGEPSDRGVASENYAAPPTAPPSATSTPSGWPSTESSPRCARATRFKGDDQTPVEARCSGSPRSRPPRNRAAGAAHRRREARRRRRKARSDPRQLDRADVRPRVRGGRPRVPSPVPRAGRPLARPPGRAGSGGRRPRPPRARDDPPPAEGARAAARQLAGAGGRVLRRLPAVRGANAVARGGAADLPVELLPAVLPAAARVGDLQESIISTPRDVHVGQTRTSYAVFLRRRRRRCWSTPMVIHSGMNGMAISPRAAELERLVPMAIGSRRSESEPAHAKATSVRGTVARRLTAKASVYHATSAEQPMKFCSMQQMMWKNMTSSRARLLPRGPPSSSLPTSVAQPWSSRLELDVDDVAAVDEPHDEERGARKGERVEEERGDRDQLQARVGAVECCVGSGDREACVSEWRTRAARRIVGCARHTLAGRRAIRLRISDAPQHLLRYDSPTAVTSPQRRSAAPARPPQAPPGGLAVPPLRRRRRRTARRR